MPTKIINLKLVLSTLICKIKNVQWKQHNNFALLLGDQKVKVFLFSEKVIFWKKSKNCLSDFSEKKLYNFWKEGVSNSQNVKLILENDD